MADENEQSSAMRKPMNPVITGIAGMVVGAGLGAVATKIASDKKLRGRIKDTVTEVSHRISASVKKAREKGMEAMEMAEHRVKPIRRAAPKRR